MRDDPVGVVAREAMVATDAVNRVTQRRVVPLATLLLHSVAASVVDVVLLRLLR